MVYLLLRAAEADTATWELILRRHTLALGLRSLGLAAAVTSAAVGLGTVLAWLTVRTDLPARRMWGVLAPLPLVVPSYVGAFVLVSAFGPAGLLNDLLAPLGIGSLPRMTGFGGAFAALTLFTYPYVYLVVAAGLRGQDPALEETARTLGRSRWGTFRQVTLPLLRPSLVAGGLLVALYTLHDFGAVSLMRFQTFTQAIFLQYRAAFDRSQAAILSLLLFGVALLVVALERRARGRARYHRPGAGARRSLPVVPLGRWRWPAMAFCGAVSLAAVALPVSVLGYWLGRSLLRGAQVEALWSAVGGSLVTATGGALLAVAAALPVAVLSVRHPGAWSGLVERLAWGAFALPGIVVGLALVFAGIRLTPFLYQTLPLLLVAYVILFLPQAAEPIRNTLLQLPGAVEEAGRVLGRSRWEVFLRVVAPQVSRGVVVAFALVLLTAMKELPATLLLRPTGFETLATRVWSESSVGQFGEAALPALVLVTLSAIPLYLLARRVEVQEVRET